MRIALNCSTALNRYKSSIREAKSDFVRCFISI